MQETNRKSRLWAISLAALMWVSAPASADEVDKIGAVLDRFHTAAAKAKFEEYFNQFTPDGVFIGTDASERWTVEEFKAYAKPHFDKGRGWTYQSSQRHINISPDASHAWFDERLDNASLGVCRGTGVLRKIGADWKIAQYHLTIPVPNELADEVVKRIRAMPAAKR
ncbi:nuclear transport factor 2 family protein [Parachitinimonas caeni]|uniref:Nuclear transport factor 2 family protein n=1 Tax=Parachitinimonas caeni TaxID=3031301 RepID=A0ABT7DY43_9NEIS|nr:nuclear transport factor 2 family protein [Parachitinimonas caeni]MDK2124983.1 nuclear transport factor 2 family protein [Parachitinimonas caeni]